jgi:glutamate--cysteine ligase
MSAGKEGRNVTGAIIQEGVYTLETWSDAQAAAEPVVYMIDRYVVVGFYRIHTGKGASDNLNSPGMHFEPLAFAEPCNAPDATRAPDCCAKRFYAYGVVARLALAAAAREIAANGTR